MGFSRRCLGDRRPLGAGRAERGGVLAFVKSGWSCLPLNLSGRRFVLRILLQSISCVCGVHPPPALVFAYLGFRREHCWRIFPTLFPSPVDRVVRNSFQRESRALFGESARGLLWLQRWSFTPTDSGAFP
ncbi:unnamed protein product [Ectocarpus sp. 12 AP-2014]